jgi:hypothetical protein
VDLGEALHAGLDELAGEVMARVHAELPEWMRQPDLLEASRTFTRASLQAEVDALARGALPDACPEVDAEGARLGARAGVPLDALLRGYRAGNAVLWEAAFERLAADPAAIRAASSFLFAYADRLSAFVTAEHTDERERVLRTAEQRRTHLVREVLDGADVDGTTLGYDLGATHVGVVAWGPDAAAAVAALAAGRPVLSVALLEETTWAWIGARGLTAVGAPPAGTRLALGEPAAGPDGFRRTHRQALHAQRAGQAAVTRFADVALEALLLADAIEARAFVARELQGIDGEDAPSARLRETLEAYFLAGHNAAAAAAALGVHEQTVANRLRAVERRTGTPPQRRSAELEAALRVRRLL